MCRSTPQKAVSPLAAQERPDRLAGTGHQGSVTIPVCDEESPASFLTKPQFRAGSSDLPATGVLGITDDWATQEVVDLDEDRDMSKMR